MVFLYVYLFDPLDISRLLSQAAGGRVTASHAPNQGTSVLASTSLAVYSKHNFSLPYPNSVSKKNRYPRGPTVSNKDGDTVAPLSQIGMETPLPDKECVVGITGRMLLRLEQRVKVPEAALHVVVRRHLCERIGTDSNG